MAQTASGVDCEVLVVGAGPTGLVLALWLAKMGVRLRIVDKSPGPSPTSRALAVHARTLELYRQLDLTDEILRRGRRVPGANLWVGGERAAHLSFAESARALTPYPFLHIFPQDEHERLLIDRLRAEGVEVERDRELVDFEQDAAGVRAQLRSPRGDESVVSCAYVAGCDGAHSIVRKRIGAGFEGGAYDHLFYVADIAGRGPAFDGELHVDLDSADFLALFPLAGEGHARLIGTVRDARATAPDLLRFDDVSSRAIEQMKLTIERVNWFSTYRVHHRVATRFQDRRAFLLGDAAHIHSPVGGQGMNTGIGDAINLAWKLRATLRGSASAALLDTYEPERIAFARRLVRTTDRIFTLATSQSRLAQLARTRLAPAIMPPVSRFAPVRDFVFKTVSQLSIHYRRQRLSAGEAGAVAGGDRLPWAPFDGTDNFTSNAVVGWRLHVYGEASDELRSWCETNDLPLTAWPWRDAFAAAGFARDAAYLLRPDDYVALACAQPSGAEIEAYFSRRELSWR